MKKYVIYVVSGDEKDFDFENASYDEVRNSAIDFQRSDSLENIARVFAMALNDGTFSDKDYYYITDEENGIIL